MSDKTLADLEAAISAHIADEHGDAVAAWTVVAGVVRLEDGATAVAIEAPEPMAAYVQRGLLHEALALMDADRCDHDD